ncbi:MAG: ROK family protein [Candidatus Nomurabacteria bacterium]|jgi:predicted NBD/HSP70 family sugar kinase|nr:ROK family protein [Candidatus Nomurabacteria bacterium]
MRQFLTIDTGGTKTRIVQFAGDISSLNEAYSAPVLHEAEIPTPHDQDEYIANVASCVRQNFPEFCKSPERNVVILATRGVVRDNILVVDMNVLNWYNFDIASELGGKLGGVKVFVQNDARLGTWGAFPPGNNKRGLYLTIGTGIGGGLVINGEPSRDLVNFEPGNMMIEHDGKFDSWENFASGVAWFERSGGRDGHDVPADDPIWRWYADNLASGIIILLPILYPDTIIIGGKMAEFFDKYAEDLCQMVTDRAWSPVAKVEILAASDPHYTTNRGALVFGLEQMRQDDEN